MPGAWSMGVASPFLSERARERAPQILSFAAVTGAAWLVSPKGDVVMSAGSADLDVKRATRIAGALGGRARLVSFAEELWCVHAAPISGGWMLCVLSTVGASPVDVVDRTRRASAVFALALADGLDGRPSGNGSGEGGAPAEVVAAARRGRPR